MTADRRPRFTCRRCGAVQAHLPGFTASTRLPDGWRRVDCEIRCGGCAQSRSLGEIGKLVNSPLDGGGR